MTVPVRVNLEGYLASVTELLSKTKTLLDECEAHLNEVKRKAGNNQDKMEKAVQAFKKSYFFVTQADRITQVHQGLNNARETLDFVIKISRTAGANANSLVAELPDEDARSFWAKNFDMVRVCVCARERESGFEEEEGVRIGDD